MKENPNLPGKPTNYHAFVLRCWVDPARRADSDAYRFSLEDPHTGERYGFAGLGSLVEFLRAQLTGEVDGLVQGMVEAEKRGG